MPDPPTEQQLQIIRQLRQLRWLDVTGQRGVSLLLRCVVCRGMIGIVPLYNSTPTLVVHVPSFARLLHTMSVLLHLLMRVRV